MRNRLVRADPSSTLSLGNCLCTPPQEDSFVSSRPRIYFGHFEATHCSFCAPGVGRRTMVCSAMTSLLCLGTKGPLFLFIRYVRGFGVPADRELCSLRELFTFHVLAFISRYFY